jgi:acyl carrier protein
VQLSVLLQERYGESVDFVAFMSDLDVEEIMALAVGRLVDFIAASIGAGVADG